MYSDWKTRTSLLIGGEKSDILAGSGVAVFGLGGVGGYVAEALARAGVGSLTLIDYDIVAESNKNRQILALDSTVGEKKIAVAERRLRDINKEIKITARDIFVTPDNLSGIVNAESKFDFIVDAVDNVTAKIAIIQAAFDCGIPIISSMGTGKKRDTFQFKIADIKDTTVCPLARVMRRELKKRNINGFLPVLYSAESPAECDVTDEKTGKPVTSSISFIPSVAGLHIAGYVINKLI